MKTTLCRKASLAGKTVILIPFIALAIGATSCAKPNNCHCIYKDNGTVSHTDDHKIDEGSRDKNVTSCNKMDATTTSTVGGNVFTSTTECEIND